MARMNPDLMMLDDGQPTRRAAVSRAEAPKMTDAEVTAASCAFFNVSSAAFCAAVFAI
jgi:hypothetical protein